MDRVHIALCQGHWTGDIESTKSLYADLIKEAADKDAQIICLPEFTILPYFPGTRDKSGFNWAEPLRGGVSGQFFSEMARKHNLTIIGSIYEHEGDDFWDTAVIYNPAGELQAYTRKVHIPSGEGYHETDFFAGYSQYPVHDLGSIKVAAPTCYDQWFPELARICAMNGAEYIFYPTAIGSEPTAPNFDSKNAWQTVMRGHAVANGVFIAACNRIGTEEVTFYGSSFICDPLGNILAEASRDRNEVIYAVLDPQVRNQYLDLFPLLHQRKPQHYGRLLETSNSELHADWLQQNAPEPLRK